MKLDILVLAAHPDDAELGCGGTIAKHVAMGKKVGIADLTRGELGTRGTVETRREEAAKSAEVLGVAVRTNLNLKDGFFQNDIESQLEVVKVVRKYKPQIVLANAIRDRHIDHGKGASLAFDACFLSGLAKIETVDEDGKKQDPWRPISVYHYIQSDFIEPHFIVDVSSHWETKMNAIRCFKSQFFDPSSKEPETYISKPGFLKMVESRGIELGHSIGGTYGEGFTVRRYPGVNNLFDLL
ncbi:bacillithiol biosynthesis deacetylase BshB1 [Chryseosolibacter indicus]|uniref:Bacillithiol biosynthesis deacetylase BshB1 n=1 Tax=Chryseosolibacter indicus TaxID=2782351 RepID=A0ABS5VK63_9BACT|nr:bacillithiol biosynthesis deacetylase BshB1 [Chryseosolibacter indicus]MBT1701835.1 bacillithiol biosynthesis deacetylase BshB1 [Chryseosolibacter indicus]